MVAESELIAERTGAIPINGGALTEICAGVRTGADRQEIARLS